VHTDLCGQIRPSTPGGKNYFLLVVDDFSRYMWLELLVTKAEAFKCFKRVKALAEVESGCRLQAFRSDRGGEFNSIQFAEFCNEQGLKHFTTAPYSPQQNGVVERRNQTIVEMARCMLKSKKMPSEFWGEAVHTTVYLLNRAPTRSLEGKTPYEAWHKKKPSVGHLRTFGCMAHVKKTGPGVTKLFDRFTPMVFVGYETGTKGYRVYDPVTKKLQVSRDVVFEEHRGWRWGEKNQDRSTETGVEVEFYSIAGRTTTSESVQADSVDTAGQSAVAPGFSVMDPGSSTQNNGPGSPWTFNEQNTQSPVPSTPPVTLNAPNVQFATPPTKGIVDSEGNTLRYRTLQDLNDSTEEVHGFEYSGVRFVAAEEPGSVDEALTEECWRKAMTAEMESI
jgi:hypothetical protein